MSVHYCGVDDYGMVLTQDTFRILASQICPDYSEEKWDDNIYARCDYEEDVAEKLGLAYIGDFDGEAVIVDEDGCHNWRDSIAFNCDTIYYIALSRYPNLFHSSYSGIEEIVAELKGVIGKYLPEDFDYRNNIRHIVGAYFG